MSDPTSGRGEEMKRAAYGIYSVLRDNLPKDLEFSAEQEDEVIVTALTRHGVHLSTHTINQEHVDPFKLLCWIGCAIIEGIEDETLGKQGRVLTALIKSLEEMLMLETGFYIRLPDIQRTLLYRMVMEELKGNTEHGIGFNGLYTAFDAQRTSFQMLAITLKFPPFLGV